MAGIDINLIIVGLFLLLTLIVGLWAGRNVKTLKDYALANREFGVGVLTMTFLATYIGSPLVGPLQASSFYNGIIVFMPTIGIVLSFIIIGVFIAPKLVYYKDHYTLGDLMETFYGKHARTITTIAGTIYCTLVATGQIVIIGTICRSFLGISSLQGIWIGGVIITIYCMSGGIRSVASTDILQFIALIFVLALIANVSVYKVGGLRELFHQLHQHAPEKLTIVGHSRFLHYSIVLLVWGIFPIATFSPPFIQRMLMANNGRKIRRMFISSALFYTVIRLIVMFIGLAGFLLFPQIRGREIMIHMITHLFPAPMMPFLIIGMLSVVMSTADSFLNAAGLLVTNNFLNKSLRPTAETTIVKLSTLLLGLSATLLASKIKLPGLAFYSMSVLGAITVPLISGIIGFKTKSKSFFIALISFFSTYFLVILSLKNEYIHSSYVNPGMYKEIALLCSIFSNTLAFFTSHYLINGGFVMVDRGTGASSTWNPSWGKFFTWLRKYFPSPSNIALYSEYQVYRHGESGFLFSLFLCLSYMLPYMIAGTGKSDLYIHIALIRALGVALCSGLLLKTLWSQRKQKSLYPLYWHFTLLYCLPFTTTLILLLGAGSTNWPIDIALSIMLLVVLVDWLTFIILSLLGLAGALGAFYFLTGAFPSLPDFDTGYNLFVTCAAASIIGLVFARKKQIYAFLRFHTITALSRFMGHEARHLANHCLAPSQIILQCLEVTTHTTQDNKGNTSYLLEEKYYNMIHQNAATIEKGTKYMATASKQLSKILDQYANSLNEPQVVSMKAFLQETIDTYPFQYSQRKQLSLDFHQDFQARIPHTALIFVLQNIIRNSFFHGGKGDDIRIRIELDNHLITITDDGEGIAPENLEKIFDMFFTTGDKRSSTGIGLGVAKLVVGWFLGKISCESKQGEHSYTSFMIEFPGITALDLQQQARKEQQEAQVRKENTLEIAQRMLERKASINDIIQDTGLTTQEVEIIKKHKTI